MKLAPEAALAYVTIARAAAIASVSKRTIYNWLATGKLSTRRTVTGHVRIDPTSLFRTDEKAHP